MKSADRTARAMTDAQLMEHDLRLRREIPAAQALHAAVKRERKRRSRERARAAA